MFRERVGIHLAPQRAINVKGEAHEYETGTLPDLWKATTALAWEQRPRLLRLLCYLLQSALRRCVRAVQARLRPL